MLIRCPAGESWCGARKRWPAGVVSGGRVLSSTKTDLLSQPVSCGGLPLQLEVLGNLYGTFRGYYTPR